MTKAVWRYTAVLFAIMVAYGLLETARDAVLLRKLGPDALAVAYILIAAVAIAAMAVARRLGITRRPQRMLLIVLSSAATGTLVLASVLSFAPVAAILLYGWSGVVSSLTVPCFWVVAERHLHIADAKRGFGIIAGGGAAGALVGSATAFGLSQVVAAQHLATASGVAFSLAALVAVILAPADVDQARRPEASRAPAEASPTSTRYLRVLFVMGVVSTVTLTLGDLMFKRVLAERLPAASLASWLAAIYTGLNVVGLAVQLLATARLLRHGVGTALTLLPILVLVSSLGFVLTGALVAVIAFKFVDGGLRYSLHRVAIEILYIPIPGALRESAKPIVDATAQRGGQALAALITIIVAAGARELGVGILVGVVLWLVTIALARAEYVRQFRATLAAHEIQRDVRFPILDGQSVEILMAALASPDEVEAAAALELLATRDEGLPALVFYHPSAEVVRRALGTLGGKVRDDVARILPHLVSHADPQIRAAALAALKRSGAVPPLAGLEDDAPDVRAATAIAHCDASDSARAYQVINNLADGSTEERLALVRAIAHDPRDQFRGLLLALLRKREPAVMREVLRIWQDAPTLADEEQLIALLASGRVRGEVRSTLLAIGDLKHLVAALTSARTPAVIRRQLPQTIGRLRTAAAAAALAEQLMRETDGTTEFKILRALGRMRANNPQLPIPEAPLRSYFDRCVQDAARYRALRDALVSGRSDDADLLCELLVEKRHHAFERVFRTLGVLRPTGGMHSLHDAIASGDGDRAAAAREILDEIVPAELRAPLVREIEARALEHAISPDEALRALLSDPSDSLRCFAAHHIAQSGRVELRDELVRLKPTTGSVLVTLAFDQAIASFHA